MKVVIPEGMIRIVSREDKLKRDIRLGKVPPARAKPLPAPAVKLAEAPAPPPAEPPIPEAVPGDRRKRRGSQKTPELGAEEVAAMEKRCAQILELVCNVVGCDPAAVRVGGGLSEEVRARRITAHIALEQERPIPHKIIASATGLRSGSTVYDYERQFKRRLQHSTHLRDAVTYVMEKVREQAPAPESQP